MRPSDDGFFAATRNAAIIFEIIGLDAATFVTEMELNNLSATGTFDRLRCRFIFDADGNGAVERGH